MVECIRGDAFLRYAVLYGVRMKSTFRRAKAPHFGETFRRPTFF